MSKAGAEWVIERATSARRRIALVGPTLNDIREVMVDGESGILASSPPWFMPRYSSPQRPKLRWPNGSVAFSFSGGEPNRLRGPQHDTAWCDEIRNWQYAEESWDNLMLGLRLGNDPRVVVTTTPRPIKVIKSILSREGKDAVIVRGRTYDNLENLAPQFRDTVVARYAGTRLGRQELDAELLEDVPGALWGRAMLDNLRVVKTPPLTRVAVAIDPAVTSGEDSDETGIIGGGVGPCECKGRVEVHGFVLVDRTCKASPNEWAREAVTAYYALNADRIIGEVNNGGDLVETIIRTVDADVPYKAVHASRGKATRAEPVAALYEQGKIHHGATSASWRTSSVPSLLGT